MAFISWKKVLRKGLLCGVMLQFRPYNAFPSEEALYFYCEEKELRYFPRNWTYPSSKKVGVEQNSVLKVDLEVFWAYRPKNVSSAVVFEGSATNYRDVHWTPQTNAICECELQRQIANAECKCELQIRTTASTLQTAVNKSPDSLLDQALRGSHDLVQMRTDKSNTAALQWGRSDNQLHLHRLDCLQGSTTFGWHNRE